MTFYIGIHQPGDAGHFDHSFVSVKRLLQRRSDFAVNNWIMDSGAFTELNHHGEFQLSVGEYAAQVCRWKHCGNLVAAVSQDFVCDPVVLDRTGLSLADHQRITIERYRELLTYDTGVYTMPVLQGYTTRDYLDHIEMYGAALGEGAYVGVGSLVRKSRLAGEVGQILTAILERRPDLRLHGFGVKLAALKNPRVLQALASADSQSWSLDAKREGAHWHNHWTCARHYLQRVHTLITSQAMNFIAS